MKRCLPILIFVLIVFLVTSCTKSEKVADAEVAADPIPDPYTLEGERSFLDGYEPRNTNGSVNVVVEIPTGTTEKWEVSKPEGQLRWEFREGKPRVVKYLGYPGNYGMIPKTLLPKDLGGDGDPLDVIVLGPAVPRGSVVHAKLVGVLKLLDDGEQDDKLLAVMENTAFYQVNNLTDLHKNYPGVTAIIETWFDNYKGPGEMIPLGFRDVEEANVILDAAIQAFEESLSTH